MQFANPLSPDRVMGAATRPERAVPVADTSSVNVAVDEGVVGTYRKVIRITTGQIVLQTLYMSSLTQGRTQGEIIRQATDYPPFLNQIYVFACFQSWVYAGARYDFKGLILNAPVTLLWYVNGTDAVGSRMTLSYNLL